jgi:hypothetical protein
VSVFREIPAHRDFGSVGRRQHRTIENRLWLGHDIVQRYLLDRLCQQLPDAVRERTVVNQIRRLVGQALVVQ